jgi:DNA-binding SARP family transcriptional activator
MALWCLAVLGNVKFTNEQKTVQPGKMSAAILTYLALEGPTPRSKLAGLLWPESLESTARNNLSQHLRRLRQQLDDSVIEGEEVLQLSPRVTADVTKRKEALLLGHDDELDKGGMLLEPFDYDECPEFSDWLYGQREELQTLEKEVLETLIESAEGKGQISKALRYAERLEKLEPLSEVTYRHLMRLHYIQGDRGAALAAFAKCKDVLEEELGSEPLAETLELAKLIERGTPLANAPAKTTTVLPTSVLRPPVLAGREREWEQLENAWEAEQIIVISGEAGSGKTRLMLDFIYSKFPKENILHLQSRPGDAAIPYSTHARNFKKMIDQFKPDLEPWVVRELARMIPELGASPGPMISPVEKLRFYQAKLEAMVASTKKGMLALTSDDMQYADAASAEASLYLMGQTRADTVGLTALYCYRKGELNHALQTVLDQGTAAGMVANIKLEGLNFDSIKTLLEGLGVSDVETLASGLLQYTGGNPQFVLETVKYLMETGRLSEGVPSRLAARGHVAALIARRLQRLSPTALNLARTAAIAGTQFNLELAAFVLERSPLELVEPMAELEATQILKGFAFTHDLVFEGVLADVPQAVKQLLHARTARWLEQARANPAAIAGHWLEAAQPMQGVPWLLKAAEIAEYNALPREATETYQRAIAVLEANGDLSQAAMIGTRLEALKGQVLS